MRENFAISHLRVFKKKQSSLIYSFIKKKKKKIPGKLIGCDPGEVTTALSLRRS